MTQPDEQEPKDTSDDSVSGSPPDQGSGRSSSSAWASGAVGGVASEPGATRGDPRSLEQFLGQLKEHAPRHARYKIGPEVARGGMGQILRVRDTDLRRHLAMKVMLGEPTADEGKLLARFLEEAQVTGQLDHPGIVPVHDLGVDEQGRLYFTMQLVKGRDLSAIFELVSEGREGWTQTRAIGVLLKACEALGYAHSKGVTHRDLKPGNIMVGRFGEVYVMDWGLAKVQGRADVRDLRLRPDAEEAADAPAAAEAGAVSTVRGDDAQQTPGSPLVTVDGDVVGTPAYMSPEQAKGDMEFVGPRSDVYAMGAILYQLLAGHMPYVEPDKKVLAREVLDMVKKGGPRPLRDVDPDVRPELEAICTKAMQYEPVDRYTSVLELAEDLRAFLEGRVVTAHDRSTVAQASKWVGRNKVLVYVAASAAIAGIWSLLAALGMQSNANEVLRDAEALRLEQQEQAVALAKTAEVARRSAEWQGYLGRLRLASLHLQAGHPDEADLVLEDCPVEQRGWEWRYLRLRLDPALLVIPSPDGLLSAVALDASGGLLVHEMKDGDLRVWDVKANEARTVLTGHRALVNAVALSADGSRAVSGSRDKTVRVWDTATGASGVFQDHRYEVRSVAISADGRRAATASGEEVAYVWDVQAALDGGSSVPFARLELPELEVSCVAVSADGSHVVTGSDDGFARLWDIEDPDEPVVRLELLGHAGRVTAVAYSQNGSTIVTGSVDRTVHVWNARTGRLITVLRAHEGPVRSVAVSADGKRVASAAGDDTVRLWDVDTTSQLAVLPGQPGITSGIGLDAEGWRLAAASPDGVRVWCVQAPRSLATLGNGGGEVASLVLSADGRRMISGGADAQVHLWDAQTGRLQSRLTGHEGSVNAVAVTADGSRIVTGSNDSTVRVWDGDSGAQLLRLQDHAQRVHAVAVTADGSRIVSGANEPVARVWDGASGEGLFELSGHDGPILAVALGAMDSLIATGSADGTVRLWSAPTGEPQLILRGHTGRVTSVAFGPDGALVVSGSDDRTARVWDAVNGGPPLAVLRGHASGVNAVAVSPDGWRIVTGSNDRTVRVWDARSGESLLTLREHRAAVRAVAFDPTGRRVVSGSADETLRVWESDLDAARMLWRDGYTGRVSNR
ncbi:MAG: WD40 repeat domain-containing serine/threonine protein kinase [Planctomycetota bacterium]